MTEIPEHLLKRSRERSRLARGRIGRVPHARSRHGGGTRDHGGIHPGGGAHPVGAFRTGSAAAPAAPPPPKPDSFVVAAYKRRNRIPYWAMLALALLPLWAFMYAHAVTTQAQAATGPLAVGTDTYSVSASCHGGDGSGGVGYTFTDGEVLSTFPHIEDQLRFVYYGSEQYAAAGVEIYGDPDREGGPHVVFGFNGAAMPAWGGTSPTPRSSGSSVTSVTTSAAATRRLAIEFDEWCAEDSEIFADLEAGGDIRTLEQRFPDIIGSVRRRSRARLPASDVMTHVR